MGLFDRKRKTDDLPPLWQPGELEQAPGIDYEMALEYVVGLSEKDFDTFVKCAAVYRFADKECAKIMGKDAEPTTFIDPPKKETHEIVRMDGERFELAEDDELNLAFLEDEPKTKTPAKKPLGNRSKAKS